MIKNIKKNIEEVYKMRKIYFALIAIALCGILWAEPGDTKDELWDFAIFIPYIANDSIPCDSTVNEFGMSDNIDFAAETSYADSTYHGIYVRIWARKVANDGSAPENAGSSGTSYSDTFFAPYHIPGYFTMNSPWPSYVDLNLPTDNLRCIDGFTPFGFDAYDSLWIRAEDRYGKYSSTYGMGPEPNAFQYVEICTTYFDVDPGTGTQTWDGPPEDECWAIRPFLLKYHPDTCIVGVHQKPPLPKFPVLGANSPNPFNASTDIEFSLPEADNVSLVVTDVLGKHVKTLYNGNMSIGNHSIRWDALDEEGNEVPSGVYFYKLTVGDNFAEKKKMTLLK